jgi:hypothetical protein
MSRNLRPSLSPAFASFGVSALVSPIGGSPLTAVAVRMPPTAPAPSIEGDPPVMDRPRFRFKVAAVPVLAAGSRFTIAEGPDAGVWTVERSHVNDNDVLEVVAEKA